MLCGIFMVKIQDMSTLNVGNGYEGIHYTLLDSYVWQKFSWIKNMGMTFFLASILFHISLFTVPLQFVKGKLHLFLRSSLLPF